MNLDTFFDNFELFANAPRAVDKLRELVLELAVQGKLVEQDPNDEPASTLVERATTAVDKLVRDGFISRPKKIRDDGSFGTLPALPENWVWSSLEEIALINPRNRADDNDEATFVPMPGVPLVFRGKINGETRKWGDIKKQFTHFADGDIALGKITPCFQNGKSMVLSGLKNGIGAGTTELHVARPLGECVLPEYVWIFLKSPRFLTEGIQEMTGSAGQKRVPTWYFALKPFPLPPLAEQKRIVAKVDALMALCDRLEAQQRERDALHADLARASVSRFNEDPTPDNLKLLFHPACPIDPADLRKTILTLAVRGKLVPQDPADEPAETGIQSAKRRLDESQVPEEEQRFSIPENWCWVRFSAVGAQRLGKMLDVSKNRGELKPYLRNTNVQWMRFDLSNVKTMRVEKSEEEQIQLRRGDLLICEGGEPGRCAIWNGESTEMYFQKALHRVRPHAQIMSEFLALHLQIDCRNGVLEQYFTGATIKHLTGRSLSRYPVPLPPLAEQRRIVARVEELMGLVGQLEAQIAASRRTAVALLEAGVSALTNGE
jgi:type I restriction enzyme S subunit